MLIHGVVAREVYSLPPFVCDNAVAAAEGPLTSLAEFGISQYSTVQGTGIVQYMMMLKSAIIKIGNHTLSLQLQSAFGRNQL